MLSFSLRYAGAELRRRWKRSLLTAMGLAAAVSLIVAITALSTGFNRAGQRVLAPLTALGSDVIVTQPADVKAASSADPASGDASALIAANRSVVTNLATLGKPGQHFTHDFFVLSSLLPVAESTTARLAALPHVHSAVGGLTVLGSHQTGVVPTIVASLSTSAQTVTQLHRPAGLTPGEAAAVRSCILSDGALDDLTAATSPSSALPGQIEHCLPDRFREYAAQVTVPAQTVKQVLDPPQTNIRATPYTAAGLDPAHADDGLVTRAQVSAGRYVSAPDEVLLDSSYAASSHLGVGSSVPVNGQQYHVVGLVTGGLGGQSADVYFSLSTLQALTQQRAAVNVIVVHADDANDLAAVKAEIHSLMPKAQLTTSADLVAKVKTSIATTRKLGDRFGRALAIVVLLGGLAITILLTLSSVAKRVREIGTLRAVGWSRRRVTGQLMLETLGIGAVGALIGIAMGVALSAGVTHVVPPLTADTGSSAGNSSTLGTLVGVAHNLKVGSTVHVPIIATVAPASIAAGIALALVGGLLAGLVGGWRASSLTPSVALRDLG